MQEVMMRTALLLILLSGCATPPASTADDPITDFVVVSGLEPLDVVRFRDQFNTRPLADHYALLQAREDHYLVEFRHRCHELYENRLPPPDIRHDRNALRAGEDTIRGCRIDQIFQLDESQAQELKILASGLEDD